MKKFLMIVALVAAPAALAEPSYNYFDVSYQAGGEMDFCTVFLPPCTIDADGFALKGSFVVNDSWFVEFDYNAVGTDPTGIDVTDYALLAGWHNEMFFAKFGYASGEVDLIGFGTFDDSGLTFDVGLRNMVTDTFELNAHVGYSDLGDFDTFTNFGFGGVFMFTDSMGLSFNYDIRAGDDVDFTTYGLGLRVTFD